MTNLIDKYLGEERELDEAHGRGMLRMMPTRDPKKLKNLLNKKKIKFSEIKGQVYVGDDVYDDVEELMAKNLLF